MNGIHRPAVEQCLHGLEEQLIGEDKRRGRFIVPQDQESRTLAGIDSGCSPWIEIDQADIVPGKEAGCLLCQYQFRSVKNIQYRWGLGRLFHDGYGQWIGDSGIFSDSESHQVPQ